MSVTAELVSYPPTAVTVRVLSAILGVIPGAPPLPPYTSVEEAAAAVLGGVPEDVLARAKELSGGAGVDQALFAAKSIDTGDTGLTIVSGVRSAMALFFGGKEQRSEALAQQQRTDAALKALGLAYLVTKLVPLPPAQRVELIGTVPAGAELLLYYGAIEIAVPFAAEVTAKEGRFVRELVDRQGGAMADKLLGIVGRQGVADAQETLAHLVAKLDDAATRAAPHAASLAERIRGLLPGGALGAGDLFDLVAAGVDALPCYRYLCARLAVEASLALAKHERMPEVPLPAVAAPVPVPEAPPVPVGLGAAPPENPFADPSPAPAPVPANPFADPSPAPAPVPANPFADPVADGIVPPPADEAPPPPEDPAPPPFVWPTAPLPEPERLRGCYLEEGAPSPAWRVFTAEGVYAEHPPDVPEGVDWSALRARGHRVATYRRSGDRVDVTEPDGSLASFDTVRDAYTIRIGGRTFRRTDWDLSGRALEGRWRSAGGEELVLSADGQARKGEAAGSYRLGVGRIELDLGGERSCWTFLSDLRPSSRRPSVVWIGGVPYSLVA